MSLYVGPEAYLFERDLTRFTPKAEEILSSVNESASRPEQVPNINKKERRILKHELFLESMWRPPPPRPYPLTQNQTTIPFHPLYSFHLSLLYLFNYIWFTPPDSRVHPCAPPQSSAMSTFVVYHHHPAKNKNDGVGQLQDWKHHARRIQNRMRAD